MYKKMTLTLICAATAAGCFAAGVPCGNVALREVVRGPDTRAVSITTNAAGHAVLDFGKHQFGWLEVDVKKPGPYKIVWGELLDEKGRCRQDAATYGLKAESAAPRPRACLTASARSAFRTRPETAMRISWETVR